MSHPFGDLVRQHLSRKHGLSQFNLAKGIDQDPAVISKMCRGQRLSGRYARERIVKTIQWLHVQGVLESVAEANALLMAARQVGLQPDTTEEATLLKALYVEPQSPRRGSAPPLPPLVVGREISVEELRSGLNPTVQSTGGTTVLQVLIAIHGWPGVGKTTLAAVLAHDPAVSRIFSDGVLWASLGPTPDLVSELVAWGHALGSDRYSYDCAVEEITLHLTALLRDKQMLLIVDDVWQAEHAIPFRIGGRGCALLITTRLPAIAQALAPTPADIHRLPVLTEQKGLELLNKLAPDVVAQHPKHSRELVRELEGLPLALQVAGRLLHAEARHGWGVQDLLIELRDGMKLLSAQAPVDFVDIAKETSPSVAVLLRRSIDCLDSHTRDCFSYLGVFAHKPATFDLAALKEVWQVPDPKPIVRELVARGLLDPIGSARFQMHSLLVMLAKTLLTE